LLATAYKPTEQAPDRLLPRTSTGSLLDVADTAALALAAGVNLANGGADWPVGGARVLHRRDRGAAGAAPVGVTPGAPLRNISVPVTGLPFRGPICDSVAVL
jgi:hypothetical protein